MRINPRDIKRIKPSNKKKICQLLPSVSLATYANALIIRDSNNNLHLLSSNYKSLRDLNNVEFKELNVNDFVGMNSFIDLEIHARELATNQSIIYTINTVIA